MAWDVGTRYELVGVLHCDSPLHVGGWDASAAADLAVARDGLDQPLIPGTALAGAVRYWLRQHRGADGATFTDDDLNQLFGYLEDRSQEGAPARLRLDDAVLCQPSPDAQGTGGAGARPVIRDGVAIDPRTGTAAAGFLYEREVLPAGTAFHFRLVGDEPRSGDERVATVVSLLTAALTAGEIRFGAGRSRGLGRVRLIKATLRTATLDDRKGMVAWLRGGGERKPVSATGRSGRITAQTAQAVAGDGWLTVTIDWSPASPVLVRDSLDAVLVDTVPLVERQTDGSLRLLLPGSSIKGVLRGHAERIVRSLQGADADSSRRIVLERERLPGVVQLFGAGPWRDDPETTEPDGDDPGAIGSDPGWRATLEVDDCLGAESLGSRNWQRVLTACPQPAADSHPAAAGQPATPGTPREQRLRQGDERDAGRVALAERLAALNNSVSMRVADHVAVDRWTGGAAEGLLYSVLEPVNASWQPLRLRVDTRRLAEAAQLPSPDSTSARRPWHCEPELALVLLLLTLRDLAEGWLTIGFGGNRGRGRLSVSKVRFSGTGLTGVWRQMEGRTLAELLATPPAAITAALEQWAAAFPEPPTTPAADAAGAPGERTVPQ